MLETAIIERYRQRESSVHEGLFEMYWLGSGASGRGHQGTRFSRGVEPLHK